MRRKKRKTDAGSATAVTRHRATHCCHPACVQEVCSSYTWTAWKHGSRPKSTQVGRQLKLRSWIFYMNGEICHFNMLFFQQKKFFHIIQLPIILIRTKLNNVLYWKRNNNIKTAALARPPTLEPIYHPTRNTCLSCLQCNNLIDVPFFPRLTGPLN